MESLVEVKIEKVLQAVEHKKICEQKARAVISRMQEKKIKVRSWFFFKKEISLFDFYRKNAGYREWYYYAYLEGHITKSENRFLDVHYTYFRFNHTICHGERAFLTESDFSRMTLILETKLE